MWVRVDGVMRAQGQRGYKWCDRFFCIGSGSEITENRDVTNIRFGIRYSDYSVVFCYSGLFGIRQKIWCQRRIVAKYHCKWKGLIFSLKNHNKKVIYIGMGCWGHANSGSLTVKYTFLGGSSVQPRAERFFQGESPHFFQYLLNIRIRR